MSWLEDAYQKHSTYLEEQIGEIKIPENQSYWYILVAIVAISSIILTIYFIKRRREQYKKEKLVYK